MCAQITTTRNKRRNNHHYYFKFPTTPFFHKFISHKLNFSSKKVISVSRNNQRPQLVAFTSLPSVVHSHCTEPKLGSSNKKCRKRAFLSLKLSNWFFGGERKRKYSMGNALSYCFGFGKAKKLGARSPRFRHKYNEVVDADADAEEEVGLIEVLEDGREGRSDSVVDKHKVMINVEDLDAKNVGNYSLRSPISLGLKNRKWNGVTDYEEKHLSRLSLGQPIVKTDKVVPRDAFVPLTTEEQDEITRALSGNRCRVLVIHQNSNIEITGEVLQCLRPRAWLNDEVINVYLELLKEREKRDPKNFLQCHFFNTFFYRKLISGKDGCNFTYVRRWTTQRKLGYSLSDCDKIFVPIHKETHWCLGVINIKDAKFQYLDSFGSADSKVLRDLARYFVDEVKDKNGKDVDVSSWKHEFVEDLPYQKNGWDCGMFMIKYADFYSRGGGLYFDQGHMPYFRQRTVKEILRLKAD